MGESRTNSSGRGGKGRLIIVVVVLAVAAVYGALKIWTPSPLVVYCAHDSVYADEVLREFTRNTGIAVAPVYDTEATKSLGLVERLKAERQFPRCDVFWNNQVLGTMELADDGILQAYKGPGYERIPKEFKDPKGLWTGFAARLRVYIVNTDKLSATEEAVQERLKGDLSRVAIAKPMYGTTLTHYAVLMERWGPDRTRAWHADWRRRKVCEVPGNAEVKNLVSQGVCDLGLTDSDDFYGAKDKGKPVGMVPVRLEDGSAISIPNSVCIIKGARHEEGARKLVDFLLSAEGELALARSASRQVPLGPVDEKLLSEEVRQLKGWSTPSAAFTEELLEAQRTCLTWLKSEYLR